MSDDIGTGPEIDRAALAGWMQSRLDGVDAVEIEVDTVRGHVAFAVRARRGEAGSRRRRGG